VPKKQEKGTERRAEASMVENSTIGSISTIITVLACKYTVLSIVTVQLRLLAARMFVHLILPPELLKRTGVSL